MKPIQGLQLVFKSDFNNSNLKKNLAGIILIGQSVFDESIFTAHENWRFIEKILN